MTDRLRLAVASDLHLGITSESTLRALAERMASEGSDALVLAGDVGEGPEAFRRCLEIFSPVAPIRGVVAGNHDLWASRTCSSAALWQTHLPEHARESGYRWLDEDSLSLGRFAIVGSVSWYDYSAGDPAYPHTLAEYRALKPELNGDGLFMDPDWDDRAFASAVGEGLVERLLRAESDPAVKEVVVVTHVPLLDEQVVRIPGNSRWGISNAYYGNLTLGAQVLSFEKVRTLVSGHTHRGCRGIRSRPGRPPVRWIVVASEYHRPRYVSLVLGEEGLLEPTGPRD